MTPPVDPSSRYIRREASSSGMERKMSKIVVWCTIWQQIFNLIYPCPRKLIEITHWRRFSVVVVASGTIEFALILWKGRWHDARHLAISFLDTNLPVTSWLLTTKQYSEVATDPTHLLCNKIRNFK